MKPDQAPTGNEIYRPTSLRNTDAKVLHKTPGTQCGSTSKGSHTKTKGNHSRNARVVELMLCVNIFGGNRTKGETE